MRASVGAASDEYSARSALNPGAVKSTIDADATSHLKIDSILMLPCCSALNAINLCSNTKCRVRDDVAPPRIHLRAVVASAGSAAENGMARGSRGSDGALGIEGTAADDDPRIESQCEVQA